MICNICEKEFKFNCLLERHMKRKFLCKRTKPQPTIVTQEINCTWCLKKFKSNKNLTRHLLVCKFKDCEIRKLEIDLGKEIEPIYECNSCRYCNKAYSTNGKVLQHVKNCGNMLNYKKQLEEQLRHNKDYIHINKNDKNILHQSVRLLNNGTIHNYEDKSKNVTINIVPYGQVPENFDYIKFDDIKHVLSKYGLSQELQMEAAKQIATLMHGHPDHPEHHNIIYEGKYKSYAQVYNGVVYETKQATSVSKEILGNAANVVETINYDEKEGRHRKLRYLTDKFSGDASEIEEGRMRRSIQVGMCDSEVKAIQKESKKAVEKVQKETKKLSHFYNFTRQPRT